LQVLSYIEVNFMKNATIDFTVIDDIIPNLDPTPDYVGISLSSLPDYTKPADPITFASKISELLDYAAGKLAAKEGVEGPRVVVSDAAFPLRTAAGADDDDDDDVTGTEEPQVIEVETVCGRIGVRPAPVIRVRMVCMDQQLPWECFVAVAACAAD
jgi:hypothetical protein